MTPGLAATVFQDRVLSEEGSAHTARDECNLSISHRLGSAGTSRQLLVECIQELMKLSLFNPQPRKPEGQVPLKVTELFRGEALGRMWSPCTILNCTLNLDS